MFAGINYLAVLLASIIGMGVGFVWYSQKVFGRAWIEASGKTPQDLDAAKQKGMGASFGMAFISGLISSFVLGMFLELLAVETLSAGLQTGFWVWLGFVATTQYTNNLFEGKPTRYFLINSGHYLAVFLVMSAILTLWQ